MEDLSARLFAAKGDNGKLNELIAAYMPFIKSEAAKTPVYGMDYEDRLSLAMVVFMNCVRQYEEGRGSFLSFAAVCIHNRLIDEGKKQKRYRDKIVSIQPEEDTEPGMNDAALLAYSLREEKEALAEEIDRLSSALRSFGIAFSDLSEVCPKQKRSRELCIRLARETVRDGEMKQRLLTQQRLSQSELARRFQISEKTVEKHRKYIVAVAVILAGDYSGIQAFLPVAGEVE